AVSTLMAAAPARGLFQKAIGESGGALNVGAPGTDTLEARERSDGKWVASLGVTTLAELRALPAATILEATGMRGAARFSPVIDGRLLTGPVAETYADGRQAHVPLLAGWNRDENNSMAKEMTAEKWKAFAEDHFDGHAAEFLALYPGETDEQAVRSAIDYGSDMFIAFSTWRWVEAQVKTGDAPVYRYHFELAAPPSKFHPGSFAFHSDDIEYVFGTLDTRPGAEWRPEDRKLSEEMMSYWTNFAKTGDPNGSELPRWPRYDKTGDILHLDSTIATGPATTQARYKFLMKWLPPGRR
ncbi:MAG: carboxylesterase family protein, partial [Acidobacteriota bacterium]|nr:carboxylesterase family protein [Acidobacteriota bacterium]